MIGKNLTIVLIFVAVLAVGFFGYQHFKTNKDLDVHHKSTYLGLTAAAKINPRAGMPQMGRAINKYYAENKSYPPSLDSLYPKYINDKSFISDVNWNYQPTDDNFQLSNSVVTKGQTLVASTDKSVNVRTGTTTTVAMVDMDQKTAPVAEKPDQTPSPDVVAALEKLAKDTLPPLADAPVDQTEKTEGQGDMGLLETETHTVVLDETETPSGLVSELSNAYLVWKDQQGRLGFGNVQYPRSDGISIATPFNWYHLKSRLENEASNTKEAMTSPDDIDMEVVAAKYSKQYLVWKDENGNIGFGDTKYPRSDSISIATPFNWYHVKSRLENEASGTKETMTSRDVTDMEVVATKYSEQYLVWKDENGNIGFGDTKYPDPEKIESVNVDGTWYKFAR